MTPQECIDRRCKTCQRRTLHKDLGLVCSLTNQKPEFEEDCTDYLQDEVAANGKSFKDILEEVPGIILILALCIIIGNAYPKALLVVGASILICAVVLYLLKRHRCSEKKLRKTIYKHLYDNGHLYKIKDNDIIFSANGLNYYIEIVSFEKYYIIQLNCNLKGENDLMQHIFCANKTNQHLRFVKVRAFQERIIFDTIFDIKHANGFNQKFPSHLRLLQDAIDHYMDICKEVSQAMKEKENENSTEPQQEIRTVGEA